MSSGNNKKVIVVDDSRPMRQMVAAALQPIGFQTIEAEDGVHGLEVMAQNRDAAIVICDVNMPRMGGLDMLERAHQQGYTANLPILMLTTEGGEEQVARAKAAGAKGWIVKPFKTEILQTVVKKLTRTP
jgi:two-component system chemotaxis response regulator CheY